MKQILVIASTFPSSSTDPVPAFVKDQIIAMKKIDSSLTFHVLAPHDKRSDTRSFTQHESYDEHRFHYFWPFSAEKLAGRGIMPSLKANPLNYGLIPFLFISEFISLLLLTLKTKPDYLYAHWFTPQAISARWVGALTRTPFVFTTHAADVDVWNKIPFIGKQIVRSNVKKAQAFTAVSRRSMAKLESFFSEDTWDTLRSRSAIIPMGVSLPKQAAASTKDAATVVFIGRLAEKKGVQYLLSAFATVLEQHNDASLVVAGDGPVLAQLKQQSRELGIEKSVSFPGYTSGKAKERLLQSASVYVVPSIITKSRDAEGLPVSLMEGLAYGNVCIATNESGADDILTNGKDGFLISQKNSSELSKAILSSLTLPPSSRATLVRNAKITATQFSWQEVAARHLSFLFESKI